MSDWVPSLLPKMIFGIRDWNNWGHIINKAVKEFQSLIDLSPNTIMCSHITFSRIVMVSDKRNILDSRGEIIGERHYCKAASLVGPDYALAFCVDETLSDKHFRLRYDS